MQLFLGLLLLALSLLQPMHHLPWASWHSEILAFIAALFLGMHFVFLRSKDHTRTGNIKIPIVSIPCVLLIGVVWIQWSLGLIAFYGDALTYTAYLTMASWALCLGFNASPQRALPAFAFTFVLVASVSALIMLAQSFEVWESFTWIDRSYYSRRSGGNIGQPNQLATLLLLGLASLMYLFEKETVSSFLAAVVAGLLLFALAATESRTGVLSLIVLIAWWLHQGRAWSKHLTLKDVLGGGVALLLLCATWPWLYSEAFQLDTSVSAHRSVADNRWMVWPQLLEAVLLKPWFGWGFGQVSAAHNAVVDVYVRSEPYTYAHNIILDFAVGFGLPLTLILLFTVALWTLRRVNGVSDNDTWYCLALALPVAVHSMVEFPFAYAYFLLPAMFAIGMMEKLQKHEARWSMNRWQVAAGLGAATVLLAWSAVEYIAIEEDFRVARFEALHVGETPSDYDRPKVFLLTQLGAMLSASRVVPRPDMPSAEIELTRLAALRFPWTALQNRYALSLALNGNPEEAIRQLKVMRALHGEKHYARLKLAWVEHAHTKFPQLKFLELP